MESASWIINQDITPTPQHIISAGKPEQHCNNYKIVFHSLTMAGNKYVNKLLNQHIVIFGGTSGIGFCVAEASIEHGARVTILSSDINKVNAAKTRLSSSYPDAKDRISGRTIDLGAPTVEDNLVSIFEQIQPLDHIVFTAGNYMSELDDWLQPRADLDRIRNSANTRVIAPFLIAKHAPRYMSSKSPACSITLTSGATAERPVGQGMAIHTMYSAGLYGLARNLCLDIAPVRVNLVSPGAVATELWDSVPERDALFEELKRKMPIGEIPTPENVAEAYVYCMKDRGLTGAVISTHGGGILV